MPRLSRLKPIGIILIAMFGLLTAYYLFFRLPVALRNQNGPTTLSVEELVEKNTPNLYVSVEGFLDHEGGYIYGEGGPAPIYYLYLVPTNVVPSPKPFYIILIKIDDIPKEDVRYEATTITGMTRPTPQDVRQLIREDMQHDAPFGVVSTHTIFIVEGETPNELPGVIAWSIGSLLGVLLGAVPFVVGEDEEEELDIETP